MKKWKIQVGALQQLIWSSDKSRDNKGTEQENYVTVKDMEFNYKESVYLCDIGEDQTGWKGSFYSPLAWLFYSVNWVWKLGLQDIVGLRLHKNTFGGMVAFMLKVSLILSLGPQYCGDMQKEGTNAIQGRSLVKRHCFEFEEGIFVERREVLYLWLKAQFPEGIFQLGKGFFSKLWVYWPCQFPLSRFQLK